VADGTITYDYNVIEECVQMMSKKATEIEEQTNGLEDDVKRIMLDWEGSTAEAYNSLANDLRNDLNSNRDNLNNLNRALAEAADRMKQQDRHGASSV